MNHDFRFSSTGRLCTNVVISGNLQDTASFDLNDVVIDTGASISGFPKEKLEKASAIKGLGRNVRTANGTVILETYHVMIALGNYTDRYKKQIESSLMPVVPVAETNMAIIGRDVLKRYKKIYVNWSDQLVIDIDLA